MLVHYIEDDEEDVIYLERICRRSNKIILTTSQTIEDLRERVLSHPIDVIIMDVHRPDAGTIEDDIALAKSISSAPIILLSGLATDADRINALKAGAWALVEKAEVDYDLLNSVLERATSGVVQMGPSGAPEHDEDEAPLDFSGREIADIGPSMEYMYSTIVMIREVFREKGMIGFEGVLSHLLDTVAAVVTMSKSDLSQSHQEPLHKLLHRIRLYLDDRARAAGVSLSFDIEPSWYFQIGTGPLAELGLQHIVDGVLRGCADGDTVRLQSGASEEGAFLTIHLDRMVIASADDFFMKSALSAPTDLAMRSSLLLGSTLLSLRRQQVRIDRDGSGQTITISL